MAASNRKFQEEIWNGHYNDLVKFQKKTGKSHPGPQDNEAKLYHWCKNQRRFYKTGKLAEHRIKLLEDMAEEIYKEWFVRFRFRRTASFNLP